MMITTSKPLRLFRISKALRLVYKQCIGLLGCWVFLLMHRTFFTFLCLIKR